MHNLVNILKNTKFLFWKNGSYGMWIISQLKIIFIKVKVSGTWGQDMIEIEVINNFKILTWTSGKMKLSFTKFRKTDRSIMLLLLLLFICIFIFVDKNMKWCSKSKFYVSMNQLDWQVGEFNCFFYLYLYF